ncbi:MAG: pilin [Candidatus Shapirobacteria bacterium]|nr:pilin [Candidatus Shapirobacteria bacterium]
MFKLFSYFLPLIIFVSLIFPSINPVFAQKEWKQINSKCISSVSGAEDVATIQGFECIFYNILQVIVYIAGIAFLFMFITGGYQYLFSANDPKKTAQASSTLTMAILGVIGIIASWFILRLISNFTGITNLTNFVIPGP